ncbi:MULTISPECIES: hypothetical protein [unclassified Crossiella]|uniref:hypothetical protein n=1 Tax=unclassified Crossiella TaxID=2620835 RepID=UPI001FFF6219|nr:MULTISPECIES: hypothetical protein [unclassified Crossiella]MCK2237427.1 hypothetical protein [Crossiella sp. S99.2]MCK2251082.1 hypothetical protein [Crossiella sp. S99.1]
MNSNRGHVGVATSHVKQVAEVFAGEARMIREQHALVRTSGVSAQSMGQGFARHSEGYRQLMERLAASVDAFGLQSETIGSVLLESAGDYGRTEGGNTQSFRGR